MSGAAASARAVGLVAALGVGVGVAAACRAFDDVPRPGTTELDAAAPGDGGRTDGAADAGRLPTDGFVTHREAMDACTVIAACPYLAFSIIASLRVPVAESILFMAPEDVGRSGRNFSFCVDQLSKTFEPTRPGRDLVAATLRRIATATSCRDAGKNVKFDFQPTDPRCPAAPEAGPAPPSCVDLATLLECNASSATLITHCPQPNGVPSDICQAIVGPKPVQGCVLPDGECPLCEGSVATTCVYGDSNLASSRLPARERTDCKAIGLECAITPGGLQVGCAMPDHVVRRDGYHFAGGYCVNTTLYLSDSSYKGFFDCASIGASCAQKSGAAVCTMPDDECTPFSMGANTCTSGSKIHLCVGGRWEDVECPLGCEAGDGSPEGAACRSALADGG